MIFGTPVSWLITEIAALGLFLTVLAHASRQVDATRRILELFGFMLAAAIFENVGVYLVHAYSYDLRRIMMIGGVPLEILMIEASIWYAAFNLVTRLNLPVWAKPLVVGLFGSVQDQTIDPAAVFDRHALTDVAQIASWNKLYPGSMGQGVLSGQWNWTNPGYSELWFGIPFYNYSGWVYLMVYFSVFVLLGRWLAEKSGKQVLLYAYPFLAAILNVVCIASPLNRFLIFAYPFAAIGGNRTAEVVMLCANYTAPLILLAIYRKRFLGVDLKRDGAILFGIPVFLHLFDVVYVFAMGTSIAYTPVLAVSAIHLAYLGVLLWANRAAKPAVDASPVAA